MHNAAAPASHTGGHTRLVLIPSYNTGRDLLRKTVAAALCHWQPVWVVIDGSTDGSDTDLESLAAEITTDIATPHAAGSSTQSRRTCAKNNSANCSQTDRPATDTDNAEPPATNGQPTLRVIRLPQNGGKGRAVYAGMRAALDTGFSHALCFDADGQHPASAIAPMMAMSEAAPQATIMGQPIFGSDAPAERLFGRKIANFFTEWESGHCGLGDTLFGMRVYRLAPTLAAMDATGFARRFDFDPEVAVRLCWQGVQPLPFPVPCRYLSREEGGVSHFNYLRDNIFQILLHLRLLPQYLLLRWPAMRRHKRNWQHKKAATSQS